MLKLSYAMRAAFGSGRGRTVFMANALGAGGIMCGGLQLLGQLFPKLLRPPLLVLVLASAVCLVWATLRTYPKPRVRREFSNPRFAVAVEVGNLFEQDAHLVVGFSDTFDTATHGDLVISGGSVQGQLLKRCYRGDRRRLDRELTAALQDITPERAESRDVKAKGKLMRYPVGTTAVLRAGRRRIFAVAYSRMGDELVARSTLNDLWGSLDNLWETIDQHARREPVAMPLVGSGLARIDVLDRESLLKLVLLSFVAQSRQRVVCHELRVIIHPDDLHRINLLEVSSFLSGL
jgi:hypothetical protein